MWEVLNEDKKKVQLNFNEINVGIIVRNMEDADLLFSVILIVP